MKVALRPLRREDGDQILVWRNLPEVSAYMYTDQVIAPEDHARWLAVALSAEDRRYWIIELDGAGVGLANLARLEPAHRRCDWAFYLADPTTRGRGVGACVEYLVLRHVFEDLNLNKLWCEVLSENRGVWRLHERFGFKREALYRQHVWKGGQFQDVVGLGLLAPEWAAARPACEGMLTAKGQNLNDLTLIR